MKKSKDTARDRTCAARAVVRSIHHTHRTCGEKNWIFFLSLFIPLSPLSTAEVPPVTLELRIPVPLLSRPHQSLARLESDSSKSRDTWKWLIQVLRVLKVTHPSLERLDNDSSKSWETWKWLIKKSTFILDLVERLVSTHTNLQLEHRLELYEAGMLPWDLEMTVEEPLSDDEDEDGVPHCVSDSESESENDSD